MVEAVAFLKELLKIFLNYERKLQTRRNFVFM